MPLDVVETLCDLVRIPSVNPMGRDDSGSEYYEYAMTDHLEALFGRLGLPCARLPFAPKRENIVARLDGDPARPDRPIVVFEAHQDTVPVDGMTIAPWSPEVRDGKVFGRGACDIKGGMACMLAAISRLAEERPAGLPTVIMACSVNEEHGYGGALRIAERWSSGDDRIVPRKPDAVIVAEPTLLDVVVAHKGVVRWRIRTTGRAAHSSMPHLGDSAIYHMARVLQALETYARDVVPTLGRHRRLATPTFSVGVISGGISVNTVPDACAIEVDRRVLPGEDAAAAREHVIRYLADQLGDAAKVIHDEPFICSGGLDDQHNLDLAERLSRAAKSAGASGALVGVPYGTDAPAFDSIQVPTVVFGPGSIAQAHTCDEWVAVEQLQLATEIYYRFAKEGWR